MLGKWKSTPPNPAQLHRVGELLTAAGILQTAKVAEALEIAARSHTPIGSVLVMLGCITSHELEAVLAVQKMIRESTIAPDLGISALRTAHQSGSSIGEVLHNQPGSGLGLGLGQYSAPAYHVKNDLGELLVAAGLLNRALLPKLIKESLVANMTLARYIALTGRLPFPVMQEAVTLLLRIKREEMSQEQAGAALQNFATQRKAIPDPKISQNIRARESYEMRIGQLLSNANLVSEADLLTALELALFKNQPLGKSLIELQLVPEAIVTPALNLQQMIRNREVSSTQAALALLAIHRRNITLDEVLAEMGLGRVEQNSQEILEFLVDTNNLARHKMYQIVDEANKSQSSIATAAAKLGFIDEDFFQAAVRCHTLHRKGKIQFGHAVIALNICDRSRCSLEEAFREMGLKA